VQHIYEIPSIGIKAEGLRIINMLESYPLEIVCQSFSLIVPEPSAYILQKLLTNPTRTQVSKKSKDIESIRALLLHIGQSKNDTSKLFEIFKSLTKKEQAVIKTVCTENHIDLTFA